MSKSTISFMLPLGVDVDPRATCISYYMATSASIWHMRTRDHVITNLLHDNGMHFVGDSDVYGHELL